MQLPGRFLIRDVVHEVLDSERTQSQIKSMSHSPGQTFLRSPFAALAGFALTESGICARES